MNGGPPKTDDEAEREVRALRSAPAGNLWALVHRLSSRIGRVFEQRILAEHGVTIGEWRAMLMLAERPGVTAADISSYYAMDKMAVTRAVQRLMRSGAVERRRNATDKRSYVLRLTAAGEALYRRLLPITTERYVELASVLSPKEREALREYLVRLIERADRFGVPE